MNQDLSPALQVDSLRTELSGRGLLNGKVQSGGSRFQTQAPTLTMMTRSSIPNLLGVIEAATSPISSVENTRVLNQTIGKLLPSFTDSHSGLSCL